VERLLHDRLVDKLDGGYAVRRLGALLLARRLEDFGSLSRKAPRVVAYAGTSKIETRFDHTWANGYAVGFQTLLQFVMAQLHRTRSSRAPLRKEMKLVPEIAIYARFLPTPHPSGLHRGWRLSDDRGLQ